MRMIPIPPGPGGVAIAAMVSSLLPGGEVCVEGLNELIYLLLLIPAGLSFSCRTFSAFTTGTIDQHFLEQSVIYTPAADLFVILQDQVNNATL